jgi:hypothetical protein
MEPCFRQDKTMAAPITRIGDLDINQDLDVQARMWKIQRIGWVVMGLILLAALIGLFGSGPISRATEGEENSGFMVQFERFGRSRGPSELRFLVRPDRDGRLSVWISDAYLSRLTVHQMVPWPDGMIPMEGGVRFDWRTSGSDWVQIICSVEVTSFGFLSGEMRSLDRAPIYIRQFIYP